MLNTTVSSQVLAANEVLVARVLTANEVVGIDGVDELIEKSVEPKTGKLSKSQNLSKSKKPLALKHASFY